MSKTVKLVGFVAVALLSFVAGVKYSEQVKSHASWMFESKDEEVALPDLSNEEIDGAVEGQDVISSGKEEASAPSDTVAPESKK